MKTIRKNVFETNSSSCHCVTIMKTEVYEAIKDQRAVAHHVYDEACEYEDISVKIRPLDLINIKDLHEEFLSEMYECPYLERYKQTTDECWEGLWDAFMQLIPDLDFFKKLVFFTEDKHTFDIIDLYDGTIAKAVTEKSNEESWLRNHSPEWFIAWIFRAICSDIHLYFTAFNKEFEDENVSIDDFENCGSYYRAEHDISC